ncbi:MAG: tRNA (adenosine(37)-N6)-threonylcarbamoyltransferase complex dimerization subunit type 1 TsaB [Deltaproteobacteria bacterium]|nr:tRNA (adenosine(37)-N6)-threonylcarbamoyltransferase complex dimerization subunit type 1 TsaB [Deltaproteobacteria bacterium]
MILCINTSTLQYGMAFVDERGSVLTEYFLSPKSNSFTAFMPSLDYVLRTRGIEIKELKAVIVSRGPGSFTGLRVGLSAAKGICQGLQIPIIGVSSLESMALQIPYPSEAVCAIIDSRRGEVFAGLFTLSEEGRLVRTRDDTPLRFEDLVSFAGDKAIFIGNNFAQQGKIVRDLLGPRALLAPAPLWNLKASSLAVIGLRRYRRGDFDQLGDLVPFYLRPADIRPNPFHRPLESNPRSQIPNSKFEKSTKQQITSSKQIPNHKFKKGS